jgi:polyhydroxybutyrate depolymerase
MTLTTHSLRNFLLAPLLVAATARCGSSHTSGSSTGEPSIDEGGIPSSPSQGPLDGRASSGGAKDAGEADATAQTGPNAPNGHAGPDAQASSADASIDSAAFDSGGEASIAAPDAGGGMPSVVTCVPGSTLPTGDSNGSLQVGGATRTYILHVPSSVTGQTPVPLVIDFHPILATASYEQSNSGYQALADQEGFVVAFPQGIDNAWNIGPCCTMSRSVDDLGFARALVTEIENGGCIDPKRVYSVGYSMGGGMTLFLACNAADVFASAAPAAFDLLQDSEEPCNPARPITVISFRGTADPIVPYGGGASNPPNGLPVTIHFLGAQGTFQKWAQLDGCTGSPSAEDSNGCSTYSQCQDGVEVTLCTTQGGGHVTGNPQIGWSMLKKHPMP